MKILIMNKLLFNDVMVKNNITDDNVEEFKDLMLISITEPSIPPRPRKTHFSKDHSNVLTLEFHDIEEATDKKVPEWRRYTAFSNEMARELYQFIKRNKDKKTCFVHCAAGVSRSGAVGSFIQSVTGSDWEQFKRDNPQIRPNNRVLRMLNAERRKDKNF
jgi:predicted protein tyrosine phosphatase